MSKELTSHTERDEVSCLTKVSQATPRDIRKVRG